MKPWLGDEEAAAAAAAIATGWVAQGPKVEEFEAALAARLPGGECVAVSSCTAALHLALLIAGIGPGDEVVVPSLSFIATANVVRHVGASPVFADVEEATGNITVATIEPVLTPRCRAVIAVDQAGMPCDVSALADATRDRGVTVIEDAACALGSTFRDRPVGVMSSLSAFSFHPRKIITTGEGGLLRCTDWNDAARARRLREHGTSAAASVRHGSGTVTIEEYLEVGYNYRMTDVQAAIGLVQLARLDEIVRRRRQRAARYRELLADIPGLGMATEPADAASNFQSFWVVLPDDCAVDQRAALEGLLSAGISARRGIMAAHLEPAYASSAVASLPVTERLTRRSIILPLFHEMTDADQQRVSDAFHRVVSGLG